MMNNEDWKISMRPTNIDDYMGNPPFQKFYREVIIPKKDIPLSILFQGQFGCGKTTAAKLVASTLVCQHPNKDGSPCCKCPSCRSILDNKFDRDVKFINGGASGKDDIVDGISKFVVGRPDVKVSVKNVFGKYQVCYPVQQGLDTLLAIKTIAKSELKEFLNFVIFKLDIEMKYIMNA